MLNIKILFLIPFFYFYLYANDLQYNQSTLTSLSNDEMWLKLLHYKNKKSEILTNEFFLSIQRNNSSKVELIETLRAYTSLSIKKDNDHPRCKFPARYLWLSKKIDLPNFKDIPDFCTNLLKWPVYKNTESISLMLVSGYLGNPASTFGHSFIKLNAKKKIYDNNLFDLSVNYGALVPDNEPIIKYIFKGIFGGYEAGFSDKYFYTQDLIYSHNEFRDMWNYKLNLTEYEKKLVLFHLWEIIGKKFKYYFLDKNCAYRVSEIIELISKEKIIDNANNWYAPIETFHKIEEIKNKNFISKVEYIPSSQKKVFSQYKILSEKEKSTVKLIISDNYKTLDKRLEKLTKNEIINIIDFLLEYEKYLLIKEPELRKTRNIKNTLLLQRLRLPIKKPLEAKIENRLSPAKGNKPMILGLGVSNLSKLGYYPTVNFSIFANESLGQNHLNFDELIVGNTSIGYKDKIFINEFNLIKIKRIKKTYLDWEDNLALSWKLNVGSKIIEKNKKTTNDIFINTAIGKSIFYDNTLNSYLMIDSTIHRDFPYLTLKPNINFDVDLGEIKSTFSFGVKINPYNEIKNESFKISSQYKIEKDSAVSFSYEKEDYSKLNLELKWFF